MDMKELKNAKNTELLLPTELISDIKSIISQAKSRAASRVNSEIICMYWHIGQRINSEVLNNKRAEYGKQIIENLSVSLTQTYAASEFSTRNLRRMMQFATEFPDFKIVSQVATQLNWSHFMEVLPLFLKALIFLTLPACTDFTAKKTLRICCL